MARGHFVKDVQFVGFLVEREVLRAACQHFSPAIYEIKQRNQWQESENEEHAAHADRKIGWHANHLATVVNAKK